MAGIDYINKAGMQRFKNNADATYGKVKTVQGVAPDTNGNVNIAEATTSKAGLLSASDKATIDSLDPVAISGAYSDLTGVPTKVSQFTNDSNYITSSASITGNAATATALTTSAGSTTKPIYFKDGKPVETGYTLACDVPAGAIFTDTNTKVTNTLATTTKAYITGTTSATTGTGTQVFDTGVYLDTTAGQLTATTFKGNLTGTASKATADASGNTITSTYETKANAITGLSVSGKTITYTKGNGTTGTITTQDTNTTYDAMTASEATTGTATTARSITAKVLHDKISEVVTANAYSLPTASSTLGGVKTTSTVTSTSGLTACPIISGVPYYKDTNNTYTLSSFSVTATAAELNVLDGITATTAELNYCDGVTSNIQTQLNAKAPLASPALTGTPTAPTATAGTNTTQVATTAFVTTAVANKTSVSGNAGTATKLAAAKTISLTGDATASGSFDGSDNLALATTLANSGVTAGSYGPSANATPAHSGTFSVPYITVDAKGRVTSASTKTITLPADNNTTYSTGTASASGLTKLYTGTGTATDGTMTQSAIKSALDGKLSTSGGTLTGSIKCSSATPLYRSTDDASIEIHGGSESYTTGAYLYLTGQNSSNAGSFTLAASGNDTVYRLTGKTDGTLNWQGSFTATTVYNAVYNDYAEFFPRGEETEPGDIIMLDLESDEEKYVKAYNLEDSNKFILIAGVHSDEYAHLIGGENPPEGEDFVSYNIKNYIPVGLAGRCHVKIKGKAIKGAPVILSDIPGVGICCTDSNIPANKIVGYLVESDNREDVRRLKIRLK